MPLYEFYCEKCDITKDSIYRSDERPDEEPCESCGGTASYIVSKPAFFRVKYTQNGRVGYKYDMGDGKQTHRSATRENYEHNIGNKPLKDVQGSGGEKAASVLDKDYGRHVASQEKLKVEKFKHDLKEKKNAN